jgi:hypothetical protein
LNNPETKDISCAKCGNPMRVHMPLVAMAHDARLSQVSIIPSWSLEERKCKVCGALNAPMILEIKSDWVAFEPPAEEQRIKPATAADLGGLRAIGGRG